MIDEMTNMNSVAERPPFPKFLQVAVHWVAVSTLLLGVLGWWIVGQNVWFVWTGRGEWVFYPNAETEPVVTAKKK